MRAFKVSLCALALAATLAACPVWAVQPDEILGDSALEERARDLSKGLRCLVCRNESIDESNADLARDLRLLVRERLVAGDTDAQAVDFLVTRYGEFVLLRPTGQGMNWLLWAAGPLMFLIGLGLGAAYLRKRKSGTELAELTDEETQRLEKILNR